MELTLTRETIEAARRRMDAQIARLCVRYGQPGRIEELIRTDLTVDQVETALQRLASVPAPTPYSPPPSGGQPASGFEGFAAAATPPSPRGPSPVSGRAAFSSASWPQGRPS